MMMWMGLLLRVVETEYTEGEEARKLYRIEYPEILFRAIDYLFIYY